jgi:hypothetical protein
MLVSTPGWGASLLALLIAHTEQDNHLCGHAYMGGDVIPLLACCTLRVVISRALNTA